MRIHMRFTMTDWLLSTEYIFELRLTHMICIIFATVEKGQGGFVSSYISEKAGLGSNFWGGHTVRLRTHCC